MINFILVTDINECETADGDVCEQLCINNDGSFACGCKPQYVLTTDHITCLGTCKVTSRIAHSLVSNYLSEGWSLYSFYMQVLQLIFQFLVQVQGN